MKPALFIALLIAAASALAATSEPKADVAGVFIVSEAFSPKGQAFVPQYRRAGDALAIRAAETCPAGYDKLAERARGGAESATLSWEVRCITPPATPVATASPESK